MVVFDASILLLVLDINANSSALGGRDRVEYLIDRLSKVGEKIVVPTPAMSECLVHAGAAGPQYLDEIAKRACFRFASFDLKAAVEAASMTSEALKKGQWRGGNPTASRSKIKFDRQIVAIAKAEGASAVYSDDEDVCDYARAAGMEAYRLADLPLPPESPQPSLPFEVE